MVLSVPSRAASAAGRGRGVGGRSTFVDPRSAPSISKDFRGERRWMAEGPGGRRAPLLLRLFGATEWSREERSRSKVALREFRQQRRAFEERHQREEYEWNRRDFPELKKKTYYKWGVESARQAAERQKNSYYEQQYKLRLDYAEKELKKITEQRVRDRQKERYTTLRDLEKNLRERRTVLRSDMANEWHAANNRRAA